MDTHKSYWNKATPMSFADERWCHEEKRAFRYGLQSYMHQVIGFENWEDKKVLDFGCGSGIDAVEFARNNATVTATDITDNAVALTRALAREAGVLIEVVQIDDALPFLDETFDLAYSFGVLHHIPNVNDTLNEIRRVLKPQGSVIAMLYNKDSLLYAYSILHRAWKEELIGKHSQRAERIASSMYSERIENCPYTKAYTKEEARELFERHFDDVTISVHYNVIDLPQQRKVKLGVSDEYELGWHLIIKCIKQ